MKRETEMQWLEIAIATTFVTAIGLIAVVLLTHSFR